MGPRDLTQVSTLVQEVPFTHWPPESFNVLKLLCGQMRGFMEQKHLTYKPDDMSSAIINHG